MERRDWMGRMAVAWATTLAALTVATGPVEAKTYKNMQYGVILTYPDTAITCGAENDVGHGVEVEIGEHRSDFCPGGNKMRREMGLFTFFNAADDLNPLKAFADQWCCLGPLGQPAEGVRRPPPKTLRFPKIRSIATRFDQADGWIQIHVVAKWGYPPGAPHTDVNAIVNGDAYLDTDADHLEQDLVTFRRFLATIRYFDAFTIWKESGPLPQP